MSIWKQYIFFWKTFQAWELICLMFILKFCSFLLLDWLISQNLEFISKCTFFWWYFISESGWTEICKDKTKGWGLDLFLFIIIMISFIHSHYILYPSWRRMRFLSLLYSFLLPSYPSISSKANKRWDDLFGHNENLYYLIPF